MILDTSLLVDLLRGDAKAQSRVQEFEQGGNLLWLPTPALFELWEGVERADRPDEERRRIEDILRHYTVLPFEAAHAQRAGTVSGALVRRGEMLDPIDVQIAGIALEERRPVLTRNVDHFRRIGGLQVETY